MRIAYIGSRGFPGFAAGVEKCLEEICPRLAERGHEITLYCSEHVKTPEPFYRGAYLKRTYGLPTKHLETFTRTALSAWDSIFQNYDVIHFHSIGPALLSWMPLLSRSKTVVTVHGLDWQRAKWGKIAQFFLRLGEKAAVFFPHHTIVVSRHLERHYGLRHSKKVACIPNGVTVEEPLPARFISKKWGLEPGNYVLFASRLVPEKECHTLIKAFRKVRTTKRLVIAGPGWYSKSYVEKLKQAAEADDRVLFTGMAEGDALRELYSNAFAFCLPSTIEGLSLALLEAMSYGVCPVISDIPENTDVVGEYGVSFRPGDAGDLTLKLQSLLDDPDRAADLGRAAKAHVQSEYSWDRHCDELEKNYMELSAKCPR